MTYETAARCCTEHRESKARRAHGANAHGNILRQPRTGIGRAHRANTAAAARVVGCRRRGRCNGELSGRSRHRDADRCIDVALNPGCAARDSPASWATYVMAPVSDERSSSRRRKFCGPAKGDSPLRVFTDYTSVDSNTVIVIGSVAGEAIDRLHRGTSPRQRSCAALPRATCSAASVWVFLELTPATCPASRVASDLAAEQDREPRLTWLASGMWAARS